jgi:hypothetical protein
MCEVRMGKEREARKGKRCEVHAVRDVRYVG